MNKTMYDLILAYEEYCNSLAGEVFVNEQQRSEAYSFYEFINWYHQKALDFSEKEG